MSSDADLLTPENKKEDPKTWAEFVWRVVNSPRLLIVAILILFLILVFLLVHSRVNDYDLVAIALKHFTGIVVPDPRLTSPKTPIQTEHQELIGVYDGIWDWVDENGNKQVDNDTVVIDRVDPMGNDDNGSIIRGCGESKNLGRYEIRGFVSRDFISLTYTCDPKSKQPTKVGSVLLKKVSFGFHNLIGKWYGWEKITDTKPVGDNVELKRITSTISLRDTKTQKCY